MPDNLSHRPSNTMAVMTAGRIAAIVFLGVSTVFQLTGCSKPAPTRLDEAMIRQFVDMGARAVERRDVEAVCGQLAETAEVNITEVRFSSSDTKSYGKAQWCEILRQTYAQIPPGIPYEVAIEITSLELAADGRTAKLRMDVAEAMSVCDRVLLTRMIGTS